MIQISRPLIIFGLVLLTLSGCARIPIEQTSPLNTELVAVAASQVADETPDLWKPPELTVPQPADLPYGVILDERRALNGTVSTGTASDGHLSSGRELPAAGEVMFVLPSHQPRMSAWATDQLVELLELAASEVASQYPGSRLALGDASLQRGGSISGHASHESGRDIDIPFYMTNAEGDRIETSAFVKFNRHGVRGNLRFDVERNWLFVRALITHSNDTVQWLFISRPLAELLVQHAVDSGEPEDVIERASALLWQPSDSSPHDDHFHVRLYCSRRDRMEGCINYGPDWEWANHATDAHTMRVNELLRAFDSGSVDQRVAAVEFIIRIAGTTAGEALAMVAADQAPEVQLVILRATRRFRPEGVGRQIVQLAGSSSDFEVRLAALEVAASYPLHDAGDLLLDVIAGATDADSPLLPQTAARALLQLESPTLIPGVLATMGGADRETRAILAEYIERTTGQMSDIDWREASLNQINRQIRDWQHWYDDNANQEQLAWMVDALGSLGYEVSANGAGVADALIDLLDQPAPIRDFAETALSLVTGQPKPVDALSMRRLQRYWRRASNAL